MAAQEEHPTSGPSRSWAGWLVPWQAAGSLPVLATRHPLVGSPQTTGRAAARAGPEDVASELDRGADPNRVVEERTALL